ncbi:MAG: hypothetical protein A3E88_04030 [Legionellales bacterium RIFCSPHIGHO2_12_FULL_35_11]|nr:MAG: hypothetical protein A3E88_04030 [Legionellales bacterium RIFCSPHIGHO2_12_FULL_35_11]
MKITKLLLHFISNNRLGFVYLITLILIPDLSFAEINTQYPGCTPNGSTAAELKTRPKYFYIPQTPLNQEALAAKAAAEKQ